MTGRGTHRVLLSGGIGSGKSTVGALLARRGALVIDADRVGHEVLAPGGAAHGPVAARWPDVVVDGSIDRAALAEIVFADPGQLAELEAITHPAIRDRIAARISSSDAGVVVVEVPLAVDLLGPGWPRVVVVAPREVRLARLEARGMDTVDAVRRMAAQPSDEEWTAAADFVIDNGGEVSALEAQIDRLWDWLRRGVPSSA